MVLLFVLGMPVSDNPNLSPGIFLLENLIEAVVFTLLPIIIVLKYYDGTIAEIGFTRQSFGRNLLAGVLVGFLIWGIVSIVDIGIKSIWGKGSQNPYIQMLEMADSPISYFVVLISIVILGPVSEEVYSRGFAYTIFKKRFGKTIGLIFSSLLFTSLHFDIRQAIQIFFASVGLTLLFERTKSLVPVVTAHAIINVCSVYLGKA